MDLSSPSGARFCHHSPLDTRAEQASQTTSASSAQRERRERTATEQNNSNELFFRPCPLLCSDRFHFWCVDVTTMSRQHVSWFLRVRICSSAASKRSCRLGRVVRVFGEDRRQWRTYFCWVSFTHNHCPLPSRVHATTPRTHATLLTSPPFPVFPCLASALIIAPVLPPICLSVICATHRSFRTPLTQYRPRHGMRACVVEVRLHMCAVVLMLLVVLVRTGRRDGVVMRRNLLCCCVVLLCSGSADVNNLHAPPRY